ncbi:MAG TPA: PHB depolymerase family esterase [Verrucomicrobiae bacterium]|nr:PHB depolymerase family esterase [Verrucomicrobiae bacterium]
MKSSIVAVSLLGAIFILALPVPAQTTLKTGLQTLPGDAPAIRDKAPFLQYDFDLSRETFFVAVPKNYSGKEPFGLLVFMSPSDIFNRVPTGWGPVLEKRKLIFVAPQNVGNNQQTARRAGMAVVCAHKLPRLANIDTNRIYVAGLSGGARIASWASFAHPRLFSGVCSICGVNFCRKVPRVQATETDEYGYFSIDTPRIRETKRRVRFALVTGSKDFRHGNILDIYIGGFLPDGFQAKLLDIDGMPHALCPAPVLDEALGFIESRPEEPINGKDAAPLVSSR